VTAHFDRVELRVSDVDRPAMDAATPIKAALIAQRAIYCANCLWPPA
jgi:hypothetical protein